ncbi:spore coat protein [Oceanobacillus kimchii]|uniref:spore coat protein n=1 Tax=Oceanobacillus kimchii TaxID=746691 RepID=UPI0021A42B25|nr:spore coat protein [Oceanobacillus kimchii]MCT1576742.1 spore coat protein [Oceanobacillus kimchii]MCT2134812.1 spore coat protein [Oceanobacillus kimchii]
MENNQKQNEQMNSSAVPPRMNHGGHEMFDVHEVLSGSINTINTYTLLSEQIRDPELRDILERQKSFMKEEYNITLECFKTGQDPSMPTQSYKMNQDNQFTYGLKASQPKKPMQATAEVNDETIALGMLSAVKASVPVKAGAALETTNPVVRRVLADSLPNCIEMAYEISLYQNKHGYYQVPQLTPQDMMQMQEGYAPTNVQSQNPNKPPLH